MAIADELIPLRPEYMPAPFWFWNDAMDPREVRRQIVEMSQQNIGGFYMHARMGRVTPYMSGPWMESIRAAVEEAGRLGLHAWIYDEDGWPSGYGGGAVIDLGRDYLQQYAVAEVVPGARQTSATVGEGAEIIAVFTARKSAEGFTDVRRLTGMPAGNGTGDSTPAAGDHLIIFRRELYDDRRFFAPECWADGYVDVLNPKVTRAFIRKIYEAYRREIGEHFGRTVPGVFTDEPNYHDHDWAGNIVRLAISPVLEREFARRFGGPLVDALATIGFGGPDAVRARWCYYSALAHLFAHNYTRLLADWCSGHGLVMTGHYLLEEAPRFATQVVGDVMQHYAHQEYPGIDHLGKDLDLAAPWSSAQVLVKQAASVAHQLDKPRVMCETYAGGGWDFGPLEQKWMGDWLYALGVNLSCPHALHYGLRGFRKRDYPPSLGFQQPWWPFSADLGAHVSRLGYLLTRGRRIVRVLVLHPIESFFATHEVAGHPWPDDPLATGLKDLVRHLLAHQIDFDFGSEVLLRTHGRVDGPRIVIGTGVYDVVIVPPSVTWRRSTVSALRRFIAGGGKLLVVDPRPTHVEGRPSDGWDRWLRKAVPLGSWNDPHFERQLVEQVAPAAEPACRLVGDHPPDRQVMVMHRRTEAHDVFFLASGAKRPHTSRAVFRVPGTPSLLDTVTGRLTPLPHARDGDGCAVDLDFDYGRSFPIVIDRDTHAVASSDTLISEIVVCRAGDRVNYHLDGDNALILDRGELWIDGRPASGRFLLDARAELAQHGEGTPARLRFTFESDLPVPAAWLLLETPEEFQVEINGRPQPVTSAGDWVVDSCLRRSVLVGGLRPGRNTVELRFCWHPTLELEPLYILGRFGVLVDGPTCRITTLPDRLAIGSWHDQGLAFYAGCVTYPFEIDLSTTADRWELFCPHYRSAVRVMVNGIVTGTLMWPPHCLDVTAYLRPGRNRLDLQVANSARNFFGPHHLTIEDDIDCLGPANFFDTEHRTAEYRLKPAGLLGDVILRGYTSAS